MLVGIEQALRKSGIFKILSCTVLGTWTLNHKWMMRKWYPMFFIYNCNQLYWICYHGNTGLSHITTQTIHNVLMLTPEIKTKHITIHPEIILSLCPNFTNIESTLRNILQDRNGASCVPGINKSHFSMNICGDICCNFNKGVFRWSKSSKNMPISCIPLGWGVFYQHILI